MGPWKSILSGLALLVVGAGCVTNPHPPVKRIAFAGVPADEALRASALAIATNDFPKVQDILQSPTREREFSIEFTPIWHFGGMGGYTAGNMIQLNPALLTNNPARLASTLRHEMAHLLQNYAHGAPHYWREGICDYVAWRI